MSAVRQWYPHYVRDFKAKTSHLSLAERGAYRALMDEYWERQGPLPACDKALCRIIVAFPDEWTEIKSNVLSFFEEREGRLYHARVDEEIRKAQSQHSAKTERMARARAGIGAAAKADPITDAVIEPIAEPAAGPTYTNTITLRDKLPSVPVAARAGVGGFSEKNGGGEFDVERFLTDDDRSKAKKNAPGWDIYHLIHVYNGSVDMRGRPKYPGKAFAAWCANYTKGRPP